MGQRREEREHRKRAARMEEERIWKVDRRRRVEQMDRKRQTLTSEERQRKVKKVEEQKRQAQTLQERNRRVQKQTVTQAHVCLPAPLNLTFLGYNEPAQGRCCYRY